MSLRALALAALLFAGCKAPTDGVPDAMASPQASAMPAPLASPQAVASVTTPTTTPEGGPPPVPLRGDVALGPDTLTRETTNGYSLEAVLRPSDLAGPPKANEVNNAGIEAARKKTELRLAIDVSPSRMRMQMLGAGWIVPADSELRSRSDHYGHVLVYPGGATYRPLAPGALRALLGERRFDVAPVTVADITSKEGARTRQVSVTTRAAKATFEIGHLPELGEGGILVCRVLLDLMNASPGSTLCGDGELPLRAELRWTAHGSIQFELVNITKKTDMSIAGLLVPPSNAVYAAVPMTAAGVQAMLSMNELAALRTGPVDVPPPARGGNDTGLIIANQTDQVRMLFLDGVPIAWAAPGARDLIQGLHKGRYTAQWRTFLAETVDPPTLLVVPGSLQVGGADAGVR